MSLTVQCISEDFYESFDLLQRQFNKRFQILLRIQSYSQQKSPDLIRMFSQVVKHQLKSEQDRSNFQQKHINSLRKISFNKQFKKKITQFSFDIIKKLNQSLPISIQKHYSNLPRLYQNYFQSIYKFDYVKRIKEIKLNNPENNKIPLYISLLSLLFQCISVILKTKLESVLDTLVVKKKKTIDNIMNIKHQILKQKEKQIKQMKQKQQKYCQLKYKVRLPSLKCGLFVQKFRDNSLITKKDNKCAIQIFGIRPKRPSLILDNSLKYTKQIDTSLKHDTHTLIQVQCLQKQQIPFKKQSFQTCVTQIRPTKRKLILPQSPKLKSSKLMYKFNPNIKNIQNKQQFIEQFTSIFSLIKKVFQLDIQIDVSKTDKKKYSKQQWLSVNQSKLIDILLARNSLIHKQVCNYSGKYLKINKI